MQILSNDDLKLKNDSVLNKWIKQRFNGHQVSVIYTNTEKCLENFHDYLNKQYKLADSRILRCNWLSPEHRGEKGTWFIFVELSAQN